jgi:nucleotide-binding universal stress UspA family protein
MSHALLGVDVDADRAVAQARHVTSLDGVDEATLLHVFTGDNEVGASVNQIGSVRRAREHLEDEGVAVTLREASGDPADEILAAADDVDPDLLAVSGRGRTPAGKAVFGSVSQEVLLRSARPVLYCPVEDA